MAGRTAATEVLIDGQWSPAPIYGWACNEIGSGVIAGQFTVKGGGLQSD